MLMFFEILFFFFILISTVTLTSHLIGLKDVNYKYAPLEGLRGLAASLVAIFHLYWRAGGPADRYWAIDYLDSSLLKRAILLVGELPVGVFFMLSGFLFFQKVLYSNHFNVKDFFLSRICRIYPPVIASLIIIYIATGIMSHGAFTTPLSWFIEALPFVREYRGSLVNAFPINITNSGVFWTLVWEVRLYLCIPLLFVLMRYTPYKKTAILLTMVAIIVLDKTGFLASATAGYIMYFLAGFMVAATGDRQIKNVDLLATLLLIVVLFVTRKAYSPTTALYIMPLFYLVKNKADFFGILTSRPFKMLGVCSFSIYLIHGITQTVAKHYLYEYHNYIWIIASLILTGVSAPILYAGIERRFMFRRKPDVSLSPS